MIVFDLICTSNHIFEGWFASSDDYSAQKDKGLLMCPQCGSGDISKSVMAPQIGKKSNQTAQINTLPQNDIVSLPQNKSQPEINAASILHQIDEGRSNDLATKDKIITPEITDQLGHVVKKAMAEVQEKILKNSTWVGGEFAEEARAIYYGETNNRQIHGHASSNEVSELQDEGIDIAALPIPYIPPDLKN